MVVAQQDPDHLRGSVGAAERYPVGTAGSGGVVVFQSQQATLRRLNKSFDGFFRRVKAGQTAGLSHGSRARPDSTVWNGPRTVTALVGCPSRAGCICRVSVRSRSTCIGSAGPGEDDPDQTSRAALDAGAVLR